MFHPRIYRPFYGPSFSAPAASNLNAQHQIQVRYGANLKELKARIKSVKGISKITSSMKMVAAAKSKSARVRMEECSAFGASVTNGPFEFKENSDMANPETFQKHLFVLVTADKGLCGPINSSVIKAYRSHVKTASDRGDNTEFRFVTVGEKARQAMYRKEGDHMVVAANDVAKRGIPFSESLAIAEYINTEEFDKLSIVRNKWVSPLLFEIETIDLPGRQRFISEGFDNLKTTYNCDGTISHLLADVFPYQVASIIHSAIVENQAVEISSRQNSMDNATKNADGMVSKLTLEFNKARQAGITTELAEIVSGAESMKAK